MKTPYFPLFVDINDKQVTVVGGGKIATRRIHTLLSFGAKIKIISPLLCDELRKIIEKYQNEEKSNKIMVLEREYRDGDIKGAVMVIAATDDKNVNRLVREACESEKIPVNVIDDQRQCDFYFPSVVKTEQVVIGINSGGENPGYVKKVRKDIEKLFHAESGYRD